MFSRLFVIYTDVILFVLSLFIRSLLSLDLNLKFVHEHLLNPQLIKILYDAVQ